jgi:three-Cys-motif partner protein
MRQRVGEGLGQLPEHGQRAVVAQPAGGMQALPRLLGLVQQRGHGGLKRVEGQQRHHRIVAQAADGTVVRTAFPPTVRRGRGQAAWGRGGNGAAGSPRFVGGSGGGGAAAARMPRFLCVSRDQSFDAIGRRPGGTRGKAVPRGVMTTGERRVGPPADQPARRHRASDYAGDAMADPVLWNLDDHTRAKHRVLRAYLDAWIPIMAQQALKMRGYMGGSPRLLMVDGFAGPGRYATGEPGSPLIMLSALLEHDAFPRLGHVRFLYLFIEHDPRRVAHLESELEKLDLPANVEIMLEHGEFETSFGRLVDDVHRRGHRLVPTFAFIDPFGYSAASMSLAGKFLDFPRCEALVFLPLTHVHRFVGRAGQEAAMTSLFGSDRWKEARALGGAERRQFLLDLFEEQLLAQGQVEYVDSFALRTRDGNDYRLVFATGHRRGLEVMKSAMWSVDPEEGTRYVAQTDAGQEVLFVPPAQADTGPLLDQLRTTFGTDWFTIEQAADVTLFQTPFHPSSHLKRMTLKRAEEARTIEVDRPPDKRRGTFPDGVRMRFVA